MAPANFDSSIVECGASRKWVFTTDAVGQSKGRGNGEPVPFHDLPHGSLFSIKLLDLTCFIGLGVLPLHAVDLLAFLSCKSRRF